MQRASPCKTETALVSAYHARRCHKAQPSPTKSVLAVLAGGGYVYRESRFVPFRLGKGLKALRFPNGTFDILPLPSSGDLEAAYRAIGVPTISAFMPFRRSAAFLLPLVQLAFRSAPSVDGSKQSSRNGGHVSEKARRAAREPPMSGHGR
jgi:hypothetical protein